MSDTMKKLYDVIDLTSRTHIEDSYTCYLFERGLDTILSKIGADCCDTVIAAKNGAHMDMIYEISDLLYHVTALMVAKDIKLEDVMAELDRRTERIGVSARQNVAKTN